MLRGSAPRAPWRRGGGERAVGGRRQPQPDPLWRSLRGLPDGTRERLGKRRPDSGGIEIIRQVVARSERNGEGWYRAEQVRVQGQLLLAADGVDAEVRAERYFNEALRIAGRQKVTAWSFALPSAWPRFSSAAIATRKHAGCFRRFTGNSPKDFETADLRSARQLLAGLS